jgi:tRNA(fMet)-specific endonuclease VapC
MLDTDVYSIFTGNNAARKEPYRQHLQSHTLVLSFITVGEQYAGVLKMIRRGEWSQDHLVKLEERLKLVVVVPYDVEVCKAYADLKTALRNPDGSHRVIPCNDLWIAACAVRHSLTLVTHNRKHFSGIPGLTIISEAPPL